MALEYFLPCICELMASQSLRRIPNVSLMFGDAANNCCASRRTEAAVADFLFDFSCCPRNAVKVVELKELFVTNAALSDIMTVRTEASFPNLVP